MLINGSQQKQLCAAFKSAFPTHQDLEMMVSYGLSENLSNITHNGNLEYAIFELIRWAIAREKLGQLVTSALERNRENAQLRSIAKQLGLENATSSQDNSYSPEDFERDIKLYTAHIERSLRNLKIVGAVPKDLNADPELSGIFVPLRIALNDRQIDVSQQPTTIVAALEQYPCLVLLGGPGSGKSTATKYLAWSHSAINQSPTAVAQTELLTGNLLPLRIELRRLNEERKRADYDFLSFVTKVLLQREGVQINPQMFKELLERQRMLLLFDGLDEVATVNERLGLVNEIEQFTLCYPGNRVLVTSRPVGYHIARISHPLFTHAEVQNFNDEQIEQFLLNWYTAVLRLSPIPQKERDELDLLLTTLKENPRLHKLAENPLLLTVITALHRYERLPDRRVLVYDRCADLLLENWAKIRGTHKRWADMKLVKEDQYACIAYLGFVLHERSQEETDNDDEDPESKTVDVSSRFLINNVETFLRERKLIIGSAEQRAEAKRFIALVQEEAGLIVERGTDENGEALYSFVHRTFQEYFAAADVYERYQQEEDPQIISDFLVRHLHDPHWQEVIRLLLGKLRSKPVTNQLRQILLGKVKSRRSAYTEIIQQDLFFVCDCLVEEIKVENTLVEMVKDRLCNVVRESPFPHQREEALRYLGKLMQTRLYVGQGRQELVMFATKEDLLDTKTRLVAIQALYLCSSPQSEERQMADRTMTNLLKHPDLSVEQISETTMSFYNPRISKRKQLATNIHCQLLKRPDLSVEQISLTAYYLYICSSQAPENQQLATSLLSELLKRPDLSVEQISLTAVHLYICSPQAPENQQLATSLLSELLKRPDLSVKQISLTAYHLYFCSPQAPENQQLATNTLRKLLNRTDLSAEQIKETAESLYRSSPPASEANQLAISTLLTLLSHPDKAKSVGDVYHILRAAVPQFHKLSLTTTQ